MNARRRWWWWALIVASTVTTAVLATPSLRLGPELVSSTIYPAQEINLAFDHARHLDGLGLDCASCHTLAGVSRSPRDNLLPLEETCVPCHGESTRIRGRGSDEAEPRCLHCHPGAEDQVVSTRIPPARLYFSHEAHEEEECVRCHSRVPVRALATADDLPEMELCLGCHVERQASRRCETCHFARPDGRLRTTFGEQRLRPAPWMFGTEHGPGWSTDHGSVATARSAFCDACHQQHECLACHDGQIRPRDVHPGDWLASHSIEARSGELRCQGCHRRQSFCRTCHLRAGVSWRSPVARLGGTAAVVHDSPDWITTPGPRHGREARRNIGTCVSCHAGEDCVTCHATINPHGPGFERRCSALVRAGSRACVACHGSASGLCE